MSPVDGLLFQSANPSVRSDPARADIACFVGFVTCRDSAASQRTRLEQAVRNLGWAPDGDPANTTPLPASARVLPDHVVPSGDSAAAFAPWLEQLGWRPTRRGAAGADLFARAAAALLGDSIVDWWIEYAWLTPFSGRSAADLLELNDVPVPIESWDDFNGLFAWEARPTGRGRLADTTLGSAVRRFFLQGGRKCYVVRVGDCWPLFTNLETRVSLRGRLLKTVPPPAPVDRSTWRGVGHLCGLPDASFLCVPDLPDLFAIDSAPAAPETEAAGDGEEKFVECATPLAPATSTSPRAFSSPRCDAARFGEWATFVAGIADLLQRFCREAQFIAAVPLSVDDVTLRRDPEMSAMPLDERRRVVAAEVFASRAAQWEQAATLQTAFLQLAYPWLQTRESSRLPGGLEAPDAMLTGVLANHALTAGGWRSAARQPLPAILGLEPALTNADLNRELPFHGAEGQRRLPRRIRDRVSLFAPTPTGFQLLSDVTTDDDEAYRPANVNRLVAAIVRAARLAGEDTVFMNNGEAVWGRVRAALEELLQGLWGDGALNGAYASEAFDVRCDRSTMTQSDLDAGRIIIRVQFNAASPIEQIAVVFAMDEGGQVTLVTRQPSAAGEVSA